MEHRVWSKSRAAAVLVLAIVIAMTVAVVDDRDETQAAVNDQHTQGDFVYAELKAGSGVTLVKYKNTTAASVSIPPPHDCMGGCHENRIQCVHGMRWSEIRDLACNGQ